MPILSTFAMFFLISLLLFLFNFIPLVLINSIVWNENPVIKSKDIFQSICHVFWFATEILSMHFSRRQRIIIKEEKIQRQHEKELNNESISTAPSLIICVEGYQHDGFENNNNNTDNNCNSNNSENHTTIDIVPTTTNNSKFNDNFNNDDLIKQAYLITPIPITSIPIITTNNAIQ
ncbi:hypothetical protein CYY_006801 [Polysphondylium violaceum]|uniref:Uncharacterized protein n=1 Tax=Polysphondylium violaceum TaxID=133409 RepID=A0A8J4PQG0_9MYCE|nr:hypothetical protein CYY_006801 [Polysphondylium violaceum]